MASKIIRLASAQGMGLTWPSSNSAMRDSIPACNAPSASGSSRLSNNSPAKASRSAGDSRNASSSSFFVLELIAKAYHNPRKR